MKMTVHLFQQMKGPLSSLNESTEKKIIATNEMNYPNIRQSGLIKMHHTPHRSSVPKRESITSSSQEEVEFHVISILVVLI